MQNYCFMGRGLFSFWILLFITSDLFAQNTGALNGTVRDGVNNRPVPSATITIDQLGRSALADSLGHYKLLGLPTGSCSITVSAVGYESQTKYNVPVSSGNVNEVSFDLQSAAVALSGVTVAATKKTARATTIETPLSVQRLTTEEIKSNPGGNFDISRVVQSLPGITGSDGIGNGYRNDIIIRGGAPYENVYYLDGVEIPVINHFSTQGSAGGPLGIFNVSFIEDVRVSTSAFDARYDNALSGVFEFKQKAGNLQGVQGNVRLGASEVALTVDGPVNKVRNLTFLVSARRSYLQLLFKALDLPIRPDYYDFQYKLAYTPDAKNTFSLIGVGAIDQFKFGTINNPTLDKYYVLENVPSNNQWNYTVGGTWRRSLPNGSALIALSRNVLDIGLEKYDGNDKADAAGLRLNTDTRETENKLRIDVGQAFSGWKVSYGVSGQYVDYFNNSFVRRRAEIRDESGTVVQPADIFNYNTAIDFFRYGAYAQLGKQFLDERLGLSVGVRGDGNTWLRAEKNLFSNLSPRAALSYLVAPKWTLNATAGSYTRLPPYTVLGFQQNGDFVNRSTRYIRTNHYVAGVEFLPRSSLRFTVEAFYKRYTHVPVLQRDGISLNNLGAEYTAIGNEPVESTGKGRAYGAEVFTQQKLTNRLFGLLSYTYVISEFSGADGKLLPSAWDNRHLFSFTLGYKMKRNWELGLKYRFQGGLPYTPFDEAASRLNYLTLGRGILDYSRFNERRLDHFQQSDIRLDKKWNFRKTSLDLFIDIQNWTAFKTPTSPQYTFDRDLETGTFISTDGEPLRADGSNALPVILMEATSRPLPTIGFILEF